MAACSAAGNTLLHEPGTLRSEWIEPFTKLAAQAPLRTSASLMYEDMKGYDPYRKLGVGPKATLFAALAYFVLPADLIPDFVAGLGFTDDSAVLLMALQALAPYVTDAHIARARAALEREIR